ncbi:hypothetical protein [Marinivivus vitaminiproducens]|uniref:hypothetical protein n=1 Tax=Marinivivus vitaminiproducens TaxID=3035935 RepID=UPI0027AA2FCD|nr:hypothetical protein P4R82_19320 [Geminicoccaceae bacterium SCSIO 64248]
MSTLPRRGTRSAALDALTAVLDEETASVSAGRLDRLHETARAKASLLDALAHAEPSATASARDADVDRALERLRESAARNRQALAVARDAIRQVIRSVSEARGEPAGGPAYGPRGAAPRLARFRAIDRSA